MTALSGTIPLDLDLAARTVWAEARGEGLAGMTAVAHVLANRARVAADFKTRKGKPHPLFGEGTMGSAATWKVRPGARHQFSCWDEDDPNLPKLKALTLQDRHFRIALHCAIGALDGLTADPTGGATHYVNPSIMRPGWMQAMTQTAAIGGHVFFREA